jgi:hypothetical protein
MSLEGAAICFVAGEVATANERDASKTDVIADYVPNIVVSFQPVEMSRRNNRN